MPELPEVETVVRDLRPLLTKRTITAVRQSKQKLRRPWIGKWNELVTGAKIAGLRRRGKWILVDLAGEAVLRVHLGMTGQFTVVSASEPEPDHLHLVFALDNKTELRLRDPRRFGSAEYFANRTELDAEMNAELGPEPFGLKPEDLHASVKKTTRTLKAILLDQTIVAGVGNIYADEALFRAKLHPGRKGKSLTADECKRLCEAIEAVMTKAIQSRGSTIRDYVGGSGLRGGFQNEFVVYGRTDEPCPVCGTPVKCLRLTGRSSHFCPECQKKNPRQRTEGKVSKRA
jgi:formamidopyrimidine-DNA glycosylase